jgi:hypothetical protein
MPETFAVDTSCIIAAACDWHEQHHAAGAVGHWLERDHTMTVAVRGTTAIS